VIDYFVSGATLLFEIGDVFDGGHRDIFNGTELRSTFCGRATTLDQFDLQGN
jgi:hypothetical protein